MQNDPPRSTGSQQIPTAQARTSGKTFAARKPPHCQYQRLEDPLVLSTINPIQTKRNTTGKSILGPSIPPSNTAPSTPPSDPVSTEKNITLVAISVNKVQNSPNVLSPSTTLPCHSQLSEWRLDTVIRRPFERRVVKLCNRENEINAKNSKFAELRREYMNSSTTSVSKLFVNKRNCTEIVDSTMSANLSNVDSSLNQVPATSAKHNSLKNERETMDFANRKRRPLKKGKLPRIAMGCSLKQTRRDLEVAHTTLRSFENRLKVTNNNLPTACRARNC